MRTMVFVLFGLFWMIPLAGQSPADAFKAANQAYASKNYEAAIRSYRAIIEGGLQSAELYLNLGNSYYQQGDFGQAILAYEKGLLLEPRHAALTKNLGLVRDEIPDQFGELPPFFLSVWWNTLRGSRSSNAWAILGLAFLWFGLAGWAVWIWSSERRWRKRGFSVGLVLLVLSLLPFSLAWSHKRWHQANKAAVVIQEVLSLRAAPDAKAEEVLELHSGTKVKVLDELGDWHKVRLSNGEEGWLPTASHAYVRL